MESLFKASVLFLLTFTTPAKTNEPQQMMQQVLPADTIQQEEMKPQEEMGDMWFTGLLIIAE